MALLLKVLDRLRFWRWYLTEFRPVAGGAPEGDDADDGDDDADTADDADTDADDDSDEDAEVTKDAAYWEREARKNRTAANRERKARAKLAEKLKAKDDENKSERDKAVDKAREEGKTEALSAAQKEIRQDRLEAKSTALAAKGVEIEVEEDGETKSVRVAFADPDDALIYVERAIAKGEVDEDDIFNDDGRVDSDGLASELKRLLETKPHLRAGETKGKPKGDPDRGKGSPAQKDLDDMSVEEHDKRRRKRAGVA